jgi:cis-L-3-hydroxyproline dehydratase
MSVFPGHWLVHGTPTTQGGGGSPPPRDREEAQTMGHASSSIICPVLYSTAGLSFWGGIDPETGIVIDHSHPLHGRCVADTILCLPSGRGSCTASQVLLELILNQKAPKALVLRDRDGHACVGALIAQSMFPDSTVLDIIQISDFGSLIDSAPRYGQVLQESGCAVFGTTWSEVHQKAGNIPPLPASSFVPATKVDERGGGDHYMSLLQLNQEEREMLTNAKTEAERRAVQCLIRFAHITCDDQDGTRTRTYTKVEKGHIDGCTYIGPGGLKFVQTLVQEGGKVTIPTTLNSVSTDLRHWQRLGIVPTPSQQASIQLAKAYVELGCLEQSLTCAPYLLDDPPTLGQHIVWGESNAVVFANSMLGARTEKYSDYMDACCAIVGKVPAVGVHLDEHRQPTVLVDARQLSFGTSATNKSDGGDNKDNPLHLHDRFDILFPVLGHLCGTLSDGQVPVLVGLERYAKIITQDHMKAFCAAFGTTGTSPLVHVAGVTAEAKDPLHVEAMMRHCRQTRMITVEQLDETFQILDQQQDHSVDGDTEKIDQIALGNPHLSLTECENLLDLIQALPPTSRQKHESVPLIACMSRVLYDKSPAIPALRQFGMEFVQDTCWCMLLAPPMIPTHTKNENGTTTPSTILTNSGKYAHYGPGLTGHKFRLGSTQDCIQAAVTGTLPRRRLGGRGGDVMPWKQINTSTRSYSSLSSIQHGRMFSTYTTASNSHDGIPHLYDQWCRRLRQSRTLSQVLSRLRR